MKLEENVNLSKKEEKPSKKTTQSTTKVAAKKTVKPTAKTSEKKTELVKTTSKKTTQKKNSVIKNTVDTKICVQFNGKDYSTQDLMKMAKDVWVYDCNNKESELKSAELYIKPEEDKVYYVFNGEITGSYTI